MQGGGLAASQKLVRIGIFAPDAEPATWHKGRRAAYYGNWVMEPNIDDIYEKTRVLYDQLAPNLGQKFAHGFRILYGPPHHMPEALLIGFQPGGDLSHAVLDEHRGPSKTNEYLDQSWPLARELTKRFGEEWLKGALGTNAVFFRCPSTQLWRQLDDQVRTQIEVFSRDQVMAIIDRVKPKTLVLMGWDALDVLGKKGFVEVVANKPADGRRRRARLAQVGRIAGVRAVAIPHPTAAWKNPPVTEEDWSEIVDVVKRSK